VVSSKPWTAQALCSAFAVQNGTADKYRVPGCVEDLPRGPVRQRARQDVAIPFFAHNNKTIFVPVIDSVEYRRQPPSPAT